MMDGVLQLRCHAAILNGAVLGHFLAMVMKTVQMVAMKEIAQVQVVLVTSY